MKTLVLAGGGHVNLAVLRLLAARRPDTLRVRLISEAPRHMYSGMLPGWVAGHYALDALCMDMAGPAARAGAELVVDRIVGLDASARQLTTANGGRQAFDLLSLATGSVMADSGLAALGEKLLPLRPLQGFVAGWPAILAAARRAAGYRLAIIGGGAGGVEIALAAACRFAEAAPGARVMLVSGAAGLLPGHHPSVARKAAQALGRAGVQHFPAHAQADAAGLLLSCGTRLTVDAAITTTGAAPPGWLEASGLQRDSAGFVAVNRCQQSLSHAQVFAAGDIAARADTRIGRSGLHAVRAGPVVAGNLLAALAGQPLRPYRGCKPELYLLATRPDAEQGHAIASGSGWSASGGWVWRLKDWIDRRYVAGFRP